MKFLRCKDTNYISNFQDFGEKCSDSLCVMSFTM